MLVLEYCMIHRHNRRNPSRHFEYYWIVTRVFRRRTLFYQLGYMSILYLYHQYFPIGTKPMNLVSQMVVLHLYTVLSRPTSHNENSGVSFLTLSKAISDITTILFCSSEGGSGTNTRASCSPGRCLIVVPVKNPGK